MKNLLSKTGSLVVGSLCVAGALPASASITLYDNVSATGSAINSTITMGKVGTELADQFIMADSPAGNYYDLTSLTLKLYGNFSGTAQAKVSIYANDGSLWNTDPRSATPNTTLWSSGWFSVDSVNFTANQADLTFDATDLQYAPVLPKSFTIGLQFDVNPGDENNIGVFSFSPSGMTGNSFDDYWARDNANTATPGAWQLLTVSDNGTLVPTAFGAKIEGNAQVPEPSSMALLGLGGLGLMALAKRSRRQE